MGETVSGIIGAFKGPGEAPMMDQAAGAAGYTPVATEDHAVRLSSLSGTDKGLVIPGTGMLGSYIEPPETGTLPPGGGVLTDATPPDQGDRDALWKQITQGVNIANSTAQMVRGLRGDLGQGPGASPLMPRSVAGGMPYQPTARMQPLTLSQLLARR